LMPLLPSELKRCAMNLQITLILKLHPVSAQATGT
jgi:hypothetical protein